MDIVGWSSRSLDRLMPIICQGERSVRLGAAARMGMPESRVEAVNLMSGSEWIE